MKKYILGALLALTVIPFLACEKKNGCPYNSEKATILDFSEASDTCGIVFELEDGTKLEAMNRNEFPSVDYTNGNWIWIKYKKTSGASTCGLGDIIRISCISDREF